ncbi:TPA: hypothetical protein ACN976_003776, partial [Vibrio campbellii]
YFGPDKTAFEEELDRIFDDIEKFEHMDIEVLKKKNLSTNEEKSSSNNRTISSNIGADLNNVISAGIQSNHGNNSSEKLDVNEEFSEVLLKCFNPVLIMRNIRELLKKIGINHVYVCLDDFSEIDYDAMKVFVDVIIAPLNNLSDEFFKFKIAAYPGRLYLGDIDPQKIEQIKLDFYELYQARTITDVHAQAQGSIKNL